MMKRSKTVNEYISVNKHWSNELKKLSTIIHSTELEETIKWGAPVYAINDNNVVGLSAFKSYVGLWFFQGSFLKDKKKKLVSAQKSTKGLRQMRFNSIEEIDEKLVLEYVKEAIKNQKDGKEIKPAKKALVAVPKELKNELQKNTKLNKNFNSLTPFKQREYCDYISDAKRKETKQNRLKKIIPMFSKGIGLNDKYRR
jgi:uncharacterized protein YdeI (YjbR/CyaY-like superfamily)